MRRNCRSFASLYIRPDDKPHDLEAQETRHRNGETEDFLLSIRTGNTHTRQARMSARKLIPREKSVTIRISTADAVNATTRIECEMKRISIALASKQDNISTRWYRSHDKLVPFEGHISVFLLCFGRQSLFSVIFSFTTDFSGIFGRVTTG